MISLHQENTRDNSRLVKRKHRHRLKPRVKGEIYPVKVVGNVNPDEVVRELAKRGVPIHRKTLLRWEQAGLVPEAKRRALGQGKGWETNYPAELIPEALTAYLLKEVYQLKNADIAEARKGFFEGKPAFFKDTYGRYYTKLEPGKQDFTSLLQTAHEEAEGFKNAEHTLEVFRRHGRGEVRTLKELFTWLENKDGDK